MCLERSLHVDNEERAISARSPAADSAVVFTAHAVGMGAHEARQGNANARRRRREKSST